MIAISQLRSGVEAVSFNTAMSACRDENMWHVALQLFQQPGCLVLLVGNGRWLIHILYMTLTLHKLMHGWSFQTVWYFNLLRWGSARVTRAYCSRDGLKSPTCGWVNVWPTFEASEHPNGSTADALFCSLCCSPGVHVSCPTCLCACVMWHLVGQFDGHTPDSFIA